MFELRHSNFIHGNLNILGVQADVFEQQTTYISDDQCSNRTCHH